MNRKHRSLSAYIPPIGIVIAAAVFWLLGPLGLISTGERKWWDATKETEGNTK